MQLYLETLEVLNKSADCFVCNLVYHVIKKLIYKVIFTFYTLLISSFCLSTLEFK